MAERASIPVRKAAEDNTSPSPLQPSNNVPSMEHADYKQDLVDVDLKTPVAAIPESDKERGDPLRFASSLHAVSVNAGINEIQQSSDSNSKQEHLEIADESWAVSSVVPDEEADPKKDGSTLKDIIRKETHGVHSLRTWVMFFLAITSVLLSIAIGVVSSRLENNAMNDSFAISADFLLDQLRLRGQQTLNAVSFLAVSTTLTDQQFDLEASFVRNLMCPNLHGCGATDGIFAISSGVASQEAVDQFNGTLVASQGSNEIVTGEDGQYQIQHVAPSDASNAARLIDSDLMAVPKVVNAVKFALDQEGAVLSSVLNWEEQVLLGLESAENPKGDSQPASLFIVPVLATESQDLGAVLVPFYWRDLLKYMFEENTRGMHVVFQSSCDEDAVFTYQVDHDEAVFLGNEDAHISYYDFSEKSAMLVDDLWQGIVTPSGHNMTFALGYECGMEVRIYESPSFRTQHRSGIPAILTGTVVIILVCVIVLVLLYGGRVEYSLHTSVEKLAKTQHLVNSLFPKDVQEKMFHAHDLELAAASNTRAIDNPMLKIHSAIKEAADHETTVLPNANLYKSATIMFADIAGFTNWSSKREPKDVFSLLETIFSTMDNLAKSSNIFKVETIGDCYMSCCGLPEEREDHASALCRFAWDCIPQVKKVTRRLQHTLGGETAELSLRIGLHSGSVTAGVLRGEKARFQLFGDTVNTASRMESTGVTSRVQISLATAEYLIKEDKEHWFAERDGGVEAKGKGRMGTFFLTNAVRSVAQSSSGQSSSWDQSRRSQSGDDSGNDDTCFH